jgi:hypothetical protein
MSGSQMAGTADDNTISTDDWRLSRVEIAFVTERAGGSERLAKELMLDALHSDAIRWRCSSLEAENDPTDPTANLPIVNQFATCRQFFFRRNKHSHVEVDWEVSSATYIGPPMKLGSDGKGANWPIYDLRASVTLKANLIRFHHGDVVNYLVKLGLMPQSPELPPSAPPSETTPAMPIEEFQQGKIEEAVGAKSTTPVLLPEDPTTILAALGLKGFQQNAIAEAVLELYGRDPPESLTPGKLRKDLRKLHREKAGKAKARGDAPLHEPAEWDACNSFVTALRAWRAKQRALDS